MTQADDMMVATAHAARRMSALGLLALAVLAGAWSHDARAQSAADWLTGLQGQNPAQAGAAKGDAETDQPIETAQVRMVARLTSDGQEIEEGLVWRVFWHPPGDSTRSTQVAVKQEARPTFKLKVGDYVVNAALGRAHITRKITVTGGSTEPLVEEFVLNAGGLRLKALVSGAEAANNAVSYAVYSDRDQTDNRRLVLSAARPNLIVRLNAGIYHIVSTYGDCNATVQSDVTVEAGKLTEATVTHSAAKATFKLVQRAGGEALPDTEWTIQNPQGDEIKESVGALPTHILAPGSYTIVAKSQGRQFQRDITLANGETAQVELVMN
ncbi:hypothetical protein [uncultured Hyphomicrobium sp.]|uniref:hypothetical protein n=1 Tax=uncultured Hyphomicrobium sp. TaxID=194373 RepID=UPI0025EF510E|nr:hypothetical protein [uncultured Hyphomicrobium sp.]